MNKRENSSRGLETKETIKNMTCNLHTMFEPTSTTIFCDFNLYAFFMEKGKLNQTQK